MLGQEPLSLEAGTRISAVLNDFPSVELDVKNVSDGPLFPFQWLNEEKIIQRLVQLIHPSQDEDVSTAPAPRSGCWGMCPALGPQMRTR